MLSLLYRMRPGVTAALRMCFSACRCVNALTTTLGAFTASASAQTYNLVHFFLIMHKVTRTATLAPRTQLHLTASPLLWQRLTPQLAVCNNLELLLYLTPLTPCCLQLLLYACRLLLRARAAVAVAAAALAAVVVAAAATAAVAVATVVAAAAAVSAFDHISDSRKISPNCIIDAGSVACMPWTWFILACSI